MASAPVATLEQELVDFLGELAQVQDELLAVLTEKRKCLARGDLAAIGETQQREETLLEQLATCHRKRTELLESAQRLGLSSENLGDLAATIEGRNGQGLSHQVRDLKARMRLLQNGTLTNWLLAQRTLLHISQLIEIIATGGRMQPTYVMGEAVHARGALLDREA